mmetsp:Transcript_12021/g.44648  ORF Transcript_12021/g.44648 Transcript_12021/m.44648 type:complete len:720 (-) Transcript_12021:81-2240(-)
MAGVFNYDIQALPVGMTLEDGPFGRLLVVGLPSNPDGSESNASAAGIEVGDTLIAVDDDNISRLSFDDSIERLRRAQLPIRITVARPTPEVRDQLLAEVAQAEHDHQDEDGRGRSRKGAEERGADDDDADDEDEDDDDDEDDDEDDDDLSERDRDRQDSQSADASSMGDGDAPQAQSMPSQPGILFGMEEVFGDPSSSLATPLKQVEKEKTKKKKKKKRKNKRKRQSVGNVTREPAVEVEESDQAIHDAMLSMRRQSEHTLRPHLSNYDFLSTCWKNSKDVPKWVNAAVWKTYTNEPGLAYEDKHLRMQQARRLEKFWRDDVEKGPLLQKALLALGVEYTLQYLGLLDRHGKRPGQAGQAEKSPLQSASPTNDSNPVIQEVAEQLLVTPCLVDVRSPEFESRINALVEKVELLHESANVQGRHLDRLVIEMERHASIFEAQVSHVAGLLGRRSQVIRERVEYLLAARQRNQFTAFQMRAALGRPLMEPDAESSAEGVGEEKTQSAGDPGYTVPELSSAEKVEAETILKSAEEAVKEIEQALEALLPETGLVQLYTGRENTMRRQYLQQRLEAKNKFTTLAQRYAEMLQVGEIQKAEFSRLKEEAGLLLSSSTKDIEEFEGMGYKIQLALPPAEIEDCIKQLPAQTVEQVQTWAKRKFALPTGGDGAEAQGNGAAAGAAAGAGADAAAGAGAGAASTEKKRPSDTAQASSSDTKRQRTSM